MLSNALVIAILAVVLFFALRGSIKHLAGEGGCCGGGDSVKNRLDGASAKVNLRKKEAVVRFEKDIADDVITKEIEDLGYKVTECYGKV